MKGSFTSFGGALMLFAAPAVVFASNGDRPGRAQLSARSSQPVQIYEQAGRPGLIAGQFAYPRANAPEATAVQFIREFASVYGSATAPEMAVLRQQHTAEAQVVRIEQRFGGLRVEGSDMAVVVGNDGAVRTASGAPVMMKADFDTTPEIASSAAVQAAIAATGTQAEASTPELLVTTIGVSVPTLAYRMEVKVAHDEIYVTTVDAKTGAVLNRYNRIETAKNRKTYTASNGTRLPGTLLLTETSALGSDAAVNAAHTNAGITYDYYKATFNRDSYNNAGATLSSTAHYGRSYNNAYWDGTQMVYGDGDGTTFISLSLALDVIGHELTHAVTENESNLVYQNESGALNEAISDIFGTMVEFYGEPSKADWLIGEDVYTPNTPGDALRSMSNPTAFGDPDNYANRYTGTQDNGGVHTNSGIINKQAYLMAVGGTAYGVTVAGIGSDQMQRIWYKANSEILTSNATFADARNATIQAATALYGASSAAVTATTKAWDAVGVAGAAPPPPTSTWTGTFVASSAATPHPYRNRKTYSVTYSRPGALEMKVKFNNLQTEAGYDFVKIKSSTGAVVYQYSGAMGAFTTGPVSGSSVTVELTTDASVTDYGFDAAGYLYYDGTNGFSGSTGFAADATPTEFKLVGASPNPFNPTTSIQFALPTESAVTLTVFDALGRQVSRINGGTMSAGTQSLTFDGSALTSGLYLYRLQAGSQVATGRMTLTK